MKIAFVVTGFPSLTQTFVLNQVTGLLKRGHDVHIYTEKGSIQQLAHSDVHEYNLLSRVFYYGNGHKTMPKGRMRRLSNALRLIKKHYPNHVLPLVKSLNVVKYGRKAWSLSLLYTIHFFLENKSYEYDIVHCHFGQSGVLGGLLKDVGAVKGRVLTTFYGFDISRYVRCKGSSVYKLLLSRNDVVLGLSEVMKEQILQLPHRKNSVYVHRLGIDLDRFPFRERARQQGSKVQLITIGRLVEKKGIEYGILAVRKILPSHQELEYRIVGYGPLRDELQQMITSLGLDGHVYLLGEKHQSEIVELLEDADILLAPSVTADDGDQEGTPTVLIEASARGLPVLSTHHAGIAEVVQDGKTGFLVPERDVEALAERLMYLLSHPEIWQKMGRAGRNHIEQHYDINKLNDELVRIYEQVTRAEKLAANVSHHCSSFTHWLARR